MDMAWVNSTTSVGSNLQLINASAIPRMDQTVRRTNNSGRQHTDQTGQPTNNSATQPSALTEQPTSNLGIRYLAVTEQQPNVSVTPPTAPTEPSAKRLGTLPFAIDGAVRAHDRPTPPRSGQTQSSHPNGTVDLPSKRNQIGRSYRHPYLKLSKSRA